MRVVTRRETRVRTEAATTAAVPQVDVTELMLREAPNHEPDPGLILRRLADGESGRPRDAEPPSARLSWLVPVLIVTGLLAVGGGLLTFGVLKPRGSLPAEQPAAASAPAPSTPVPFAAAPGSLFIDPLAALPRSPIDAPALPPPPDAAPAAPETSDTPPGQGRDPGRADDGTSRGIAAVAVADKGAAVELPGPGSLDWLVPGADGNGGPVRAARAATPIEFRAADTQSAVDGPFRVSWRGGTPTADRADETGILGIRPGGRVEFVVSPLAAPARLVMHVSGNDMAVTVAGGGASDRRILSTRAAVVTVALPAGRATTVTVTPVGRAGIGIAAAELRP